MILTKVVVFIREGKAVEVILPPIEAGMTMGGRWVAVEECR